MTRRTWLGAALVVAAVVVTVVVGGCGVPARTSAEVVTAVPYDLGRRPSEPGPTGSVPRPVPSGLPSQLPSSVAGQVWWVRGDVLVAVPAPAEAPSALVAAGRAVDRLAGGPNEAERGRGLSTALGPDVRLSLAGVSQGRATVDIGADDQASGAGQLPLAVGQLVLTLTSIPGIDEVALTAAGAPVDAPLPGGVLTGRPLTARDYAYLVG